MADSVCKVIRACTESWVQAAAARCAVRGRDLSWAAVGGAVTLEQGREGGLA